MGLGIKLLDIIVSFIVRIFLGFTILWVLIMREDPILNSPWMILLLMPLIIWIAMPIIKAEMEEKNK